MAEFFTRQAAAYRNQLNQSCSELMGIAEGLVADGTLNNAELEFLSRWLQKHDVVSCQWPGDVLHARVKDVLADGVITEEERAYLLNTLQLLIGGHLDRIADTPMVNQLALDDISGVSFSNAVFCLTGDFVYAPREKCEEAIVSRGGSVSRTINKKLKYLVVGGLGSAEWKHGSFGSKIAKAIEYKRAGVPLFIIHEDVWASSL